MHGGGETTGHVARRVDSEPWIRTAVFEPLAAFGTAAAVAALFTLSPIFLEAHGYAYETSGGSAISKVHPASLIALAALGMRFIASRRPLRTAWRVMAQDRGVILYLGIYACLSAYAIIVLETPFTPLIDTLLLPLIFLLLLRDLDERFLRILAIMVAALLALNACIALAEFLSGWRLVTIPVPDDVTSDPTRSDAHFDWRAQLAEEWRATALLGHPLQNGLVAGAFVLCLASAGSRWLPSVWRLPLLALQIVSLFAFGARTSLVLSLTLAAFLGAFKLAVMLIERRRADLRVLALFCFAAPFAFALIAHAWEVGFFDKTLARFAFDADSTHARLAMFDMFEPMSWNALLFAPDPQVVATWQRVLGLEFGIESSWIGLILIYGIFMSLLFVAGLVIFSASLVRAAGRGATLVLSFYFVVASTAATLSAKTTTFAMMTILVLLFLRRDEHRLKAPQRLGATVRATPAVGTDVVSGIGQW